MSQVSSRQMLWQTVTSKSFVAEGHPCRNFFYKPTKALPQVPPGHHSKETNRIPNFKLLLHYRHSHQTKDETIIGHHAMQAPAHNHKEMVHLLTSKCTCTPIGERKIDVSYHHFHITKARRGFNKLQAHIPDILQSNCTACLGFLS